MKNFILLLWILAIGKISTAQSYLPISGGTLTGGLVGTSATFRVGTDNTNALIIDGAASSKTHIGTGFGATFIQNNNHFNGSSYIFDDNTIPSSAVTLAYGGVSMQTGSANTPLTTKVFLDVNGRMGIGTASPSEMLDIRKVGNGGTAPKLNIIGYGDDASAGSYLILNKARGSSIGSLGSTLSADIFGAMDFVGVNAAGTPALTTAVRIFGSQDGVAGVNYVPGKLTFLTSDGDAGPVERMRISGSGNVGIGTNAPTERLSVNGKIRAKEINVETGWADFVFKPDYKLRSLKETEQFITKNGHLPEIPSAKEVEENGINIGEMNSKLLQKIEELTLHLIELSKIVERQQVKIEMLEPK